MSSIIIIKTCMSLDADARRAIVRNLTPSESYETIKCVRKPTSPLGGPSLSAPRIKGESRLLHLSIHRPRIAVSTSISNRKALSRKSTAKCLTYEAKLPSKLACAIVAICARGHRTPFVR